MENLEDSSIRNNVNVSDAKLCIDFHRCGNCLIEYQSLEEFICHKIGYHKCTIVLWESKKLFGLGLQIPSFIEFNEEANAFERNETERNLNQTVNKDIGVHKEIKESLGFDDANFIEKDMDKADALETAKCSPCRETFKNIETLELHMKTEHEDYVKQTEKVRDTKYENLETDIDCLGTINFKDKSPTIQIPAEHSNEDTYKETTCPECGNIYKDPIVLKTHLKTVHCDSRPYQCKFDCPFSFKTKGSLMRHMRRHTGERPYVCKKCGRSFRESGALTRHMKSRFSCSTKTNNDSVWNGKTSKLGESDSSRKTNQSVLKKNKLSSKILISDILKKSETTLNKMNSSESESVVIIQEGSDRVQGENIDTSLEVSRYCSERLDPALNVNDSSVKGLCNDIKVRSVSQTHKDSHVPGKCETVLTKLAESPSKPSEDLLIGDGELRCSSCEQMFLRKLDLKNHLMNHLQGLPFRCILCCYVCQSKQELIRHQKQFHGLYNIDKSDINFEQYENHLTENDEQQDDINRIQNIVEMLFKVQNSIEADELELSGLIKKPAKYSCRCHICLKRFSGSLYLSCHMGSHTGEKPYVCSICKKGFYLKDSLKKHNICHSEERKYKCGECYKRFKRLSHARDHLKIHSQDFPFQCSKCGKAFRWQASLKSHESNHDGTLMKVHLCSTCDRRFPTKWSLSRHQRTHSLEVGNHPNTPKGKMDSNIIERRETMNCISESKFVCISEEEVNLQREEKIAFERQDTSVSGSGGETFVFITQEYGTSCLVPAVAIVEELQDGTAVISSVTDGCS